MEAEFDRVQRYADRSFLVQAKQDTDSHFDILPEIVRREAVKKVLDAVKVCISSVHVAEVLSSPGQARFGHTMWSHPWITISAKMITDLTWCRFNFFELFQKL